MTLNVDGEYDKNSFVLFNNLKPSFEKRRNTDTLHHNDFTILDANLNDGHSNQQRRHTIVPGVTKTEFFEKETKLIVLEFLQKNAPRNEALTLRLRVNAEEEFNSRIAIAEKKTEEKVLYNTIERQENEENATEAITTNFTSRVKVETKQCEEIIATTHSEITENKICKKRPSRRQRKVNAEKSKTVTIAECHRKQMLDELSKNENNDPNKNDQERGKFQRSSSDLTPTQSSALKRKLKEMKMPLIQWLAEHVKSEEISPLVDDGDENNEYVRHESNSNHVDEELIVPVMEGDLEETPEYTPTAPEAKVKNKRWKNKVNPNLRLTMPRRSVFQLLESNAFTPETLVVQRLERISNEIMNDYGELLADPITNLLSPMAKSDSITYDIFAGVARQVYDIASDSVLSSVALLLNTVREAMLIGNLDESQMELLIDHSTKFMTENAPQLLLEEGTWDVLEEPLFPSPTTGNNGGTADEKNCDEKNEEEENKEGTWAPYSMAAFTVGIGLAYSVMKS